MKTKEVSVSELEAMAIEPKLEEYLYLIGIIKIHEDNCLQYLFYDFANKCPLRLLHIIDGTVPSLLGKWECAGFYESELQEKFGIRFDKNYQSHYAKWTISRSKEPRGDISAVRDLFLESGVESLDSLYTSIEKNLNLNVSEHDQVVRMIYLECSRILTSMHIITKFLGAHELFYYEKKLRVLSKELEQTKLAIFPTLPYEIGGVSGNENLSILGSLIEVLDKSRRYIKKILKDNSFNEGLASLLSPSILNKAFCKQYCVGGRIGRANGINTDWRKLSNLYMYRELDFIEKVFVSNSNWGFYQIHLEDIVDSTSIIEQLILNLPPKQFKKKDEIDLKNILVTDISLYETDFGVNGRYYIIEEGQLIHCEQIGPDIYSEKILSPSQVTI